METTYRCTNCQAVDHDRSNAGQMPPLVLNCWKCGAGRNVSLTDMQRTGSGMFPDLPTASA